MCGRFTLSVELPDLLDRYEVTEVDFPYKSRFNIAPTQQVPVLVQEYGKTEIMAFRWGLIPFWRVPIQKMQVG